MKSLRMSTINSIVVLIAMGAVMGLLLDPLSADSRESRGRKGIIVISGEDVAAQQAAPPQPNYVDPPTYPVITVDGDPSDWDLTNDFFANMWLAGNPDHPNPQLLSKVYLRYKCESEGPGTLYVLVLVEDGHQGDLTNDNAWIKIHDIKSSPMVGGNVGNFVWILGVDDVVLGFEASFTLATGTYDEFEAHINVDGGTTSSTGKIPLTIDCGPPPSNECEVPEEWTDVTVIEYAQFKWTYAPNSYFRTTLGFDAGVVKNYRGWCADLNTLIALGVKYQHTSPPVSGKYYPKPILWRTINSSGGAVTASPHGSAKVGTRENLPEVNQLLRMYRSGIGGWAWNDVQGAIWKLLSPPGYSNSEWNTGNVGFISFSPTNANTIINTVGNVPNYIPQIEDYVCVVVDCGNNDQITIAEIPFCIYELLLLKGIIL